MQIRKPNLFIIGAPKCGTTSMMHYLSQHPNIYTSPIKEPHYFNTDSGHRYFFTENSYFSLFKKATLNHTYLCEGSVWYLYSKIAINAILQFNPEAKFIVMLRNPVDMFFSLHQELLFGGSENQKSALKAWHLQNERLKGENIPPGCSDPSFLQYGNACKLGNQVATALKKINPDNILFITLDELKKNPDKTYNTVLEYLKLSPLTLSNYEIVNPKKTRKFPLLSRFFIYFTKFKKALGIKGGLGLASAINKRNVNYNRSINSLERKNLEKQLYSFFYKDICLLENLIGKNLNHWKK